MREYTLNAGCPERLFLKTPGMECIALCKPTEEQSHIILLDRQTTSYRDVRQVVKCPVLQCRDKPSLHTGILLRCRNKLCNCQYCLEEYGLLIMGFARLLRVCCLSKHGTEVLFPTPRAMLWCSRTSAWTPILGYVHYHATVNVNQTTIGITQLRPIWSTPASVVLGYAAALRTGGFGQGAQSNWRPLLATPRVVQGCNSCLSASGAAKRGRSACATDVDYPGTRVEFGIVGLDLPAVFGAGVVNSLEDVDSLDRIWATRAGEPAEGDCIASDRLDGQHGKADRRLGALSRDKCLEGREGGRSEWGADQEVDAVRGVHEAGSENRVGGLSREIGDQRGEAIDKILGICHRQAARVLSPKCGGGCPRDKRARGGDTRR